MIPEAPVGFAPDPSCVDQGEDATGAPATGCRFAILDGDAAIWRRTSCVFRVRRSPQGGADPVLVSRRRIDAPASAGGQSALERDGPTARPTPSDRSSCNTTSKRGRTLSFF